MSRADDSSETRPSWPGPAEGELRPFRPADAKAARGRRSPRASQRAPVGEASVGEDLSIELLEHLSVLSDVVITAAETSRKQVRDLAAKVDALTRTVEVLRAELHAVKPGKPR